MADAKRGDWKNEPMPEAVHHLSLDRRYTAEEFARIAAGVVPQQMEDKWFVFYEPPWLSVHRSWTGHCAFRVRFQEASGEYVVLEATANAVAGEDWLSTTPEEAASLISILLDARAGRDVRAAMVAHTRARMRRRPTSG